MAGLDALRIGGHCLNVCGTCEKIEHVRDSVARLPGRMRLTYRDTKFIREVSACAWLYLRFD